MDGWNGGEKYIFSLGLRSQLIPSALDALAGIQVVSSVPKWNSPWGLVFKLGTIVVDEKYFHFAEQGSVAMMSHSCLAQTPPITHYHEWLWQPGQSIFQLITADSCLSFSWSCGNQGNPCIKQYITKWRRNVIIWIGGMIQASFPYSFVPASLSATYLHMWEMQR